MFRKTLPFRLYVQILIFSALVALGALILWPLQQTLYGGMISIRDDLISRLERQIGRKIRYSSISPTLFGSFDVRNISIMGRDDIPLLTMSRFRVAYSLLDILRGRTLAIRSVQIDSPLVNYNTTTDKDLLDLFRTAVSGQEGSSKDLAGILPEQIIIRIRNGKCQVSSGNDNFAFDALDLNAEIFEKSVSLDGKWIISVTIAGLSGTPVDFQIAMTANGLCRLDMEDGAAIIAVPSITGDMSSVDPVTFNISMQEGAVNIYKTPDDLPFDISFEYGKDSKEFEGRLSCSNFKLAELVSFSGGLEGLRQMLDVSSSGAAFIGRGSDGVLGYSIGLAGSARSNLPVRTETASYEINIEGDDKQAQIKKLRFSMPHAVTQEASFYGGAGFTGAVGFQPFAPRGLLSFNNFSTSGREDLNADITINTEGSVINVFCETISVGHGSFDIDAFMASLEPSENGMIFSVSGARAAETRHVYTQKRTIGLKGSFDSGFRAVDVKLSLDSFFAGDLIGLAAPFTKNPPMLTELFGDTAITTEISFYTNFTQVLYNTPSLVFSGKSGDKGFSGFASINGTASHFELGKGQISRGEDTLILSAHADFAKPHNIDFSINAGYQALSYIIHGTVLDGKTVNIQGSYGLKVNFTSTRDRIYSGVIHTEGFPVPFLGKPALLYLDGRLRYNSPRAWSMDFERMEMTDIITPAGLALMRASCHADQNGIHFPQLYYKDGFGPLAGNINITWPQSAQGGSEVFSDITGTAYLVDNKENYQIEFSHRNHSLNFWLSGSSMRLGRFSEKANTLQADGEMRLIWNSADFFNAELNLSSLRGKIHERDINVSAQAVMDSDELTVRRIVLGINNLNGEIPQIVINNKTGMAGSEGRLNLFLNGKRTAGLLSLKANFRPVNSWSEIKEAFDFFDGKAHVENFRFGESADPQTFDIVFARGGGATGGGAVDGVNHDDTRGNNSLIVSGGPRNMIRLQVDNNGNFYAGLSSPSPVRGTAVGNINGNTINATCNDLYIDMAGVFAYLLPQSKDIYLTGGYVNASLDIRGPLSDPEFFGTARGTSLRFMIPSFIPVELRPIPCNAVVEGNEIRFGPVSASVGKGAGSVSGKFLIDRWVPNIFDINISVPRETPIPYSFGINNFAAKGDASGKLNVSMENLTLGVSGDLYVNNTVLGMNADEIKRPQGKNNEDTRSVVELVISTGPVVEFYYPDSKFPILRANPDIGTKLRVTADTLTKQFSLTSDIKIRGGEIFYFERNFYIRSGLLVFRENELRFAPRLTARAETRDRNEEGPITISLIVDNAPLFDFTARFESSPPLSQMEILALMGQSLTGSQNDDNANANQREKAFAIVNSGADMLAQFTVGRWVERQIRNFLQLDMFSFRTQVVQNFFMSRVPGLALQPVDRNGALGNYLLDNTTLLGGKYIGQDLFLQGMLSMRYDANKESLGGLTFQQNYGFELQGPVYKGLNFRIRWDFVPEHPENWYANDNAITFTFTKSY